MSVDMVRDAAVDVLLRVFERGVHLDDSLDRTLRRRPQSDRGRRFLTQLVYGTVRHKRLCDHILSGCLNQPLDKLPKPILVVLRMGVFQALFCNQVPFPAMVHTSVDLAKKRGHAGTARLVNAVLKRVPDKLDAVALPSREQDPLAYASIRYSMPEWIVKRWIAEYGEPRAIDLCAALNEPAPRSLRVNMLKTTPEALTDTLAKSGFIARKRTSIPEELTLDEGMPTRTKSYQRGEYIFQDPASMLAAHLLAPEPGERILDCCAAPGVKATHLAELTGNKGLICAADSAYERLGRVAENVERLGAESVQVLCADALAPPFQPGFQRVLVDAPCSGLGTIRRHPDLKERIVPADLPRLAELQRLLLRSAATLCDNNGCIVYCVCTFTPEETRDVIDAVAPAEGLEKEDGPAWLEPWKVSPGVYQTGPAEHSLDGFFLTRLRKRSS